MEKIPKIDSIKILSTTLIYVTFDNGHSRTFDISDKLKSPLYEPLKNYSFFKQAAIDIGGHGISWSDQIDISEYELWTDGK